MNTKIKKIMYAEVDPLTFINNYFNGSGEYTFEGSHYSGNHKKVKNKLFDWLEICELGKVVNPIWIIASGIEFGIIVKSCSKNTNGLEIFNILCGRSNYKQELFDKIIMLKNQL